LDFGQCSNLGYNQGEMPTLKTIAVNRKAFHDYSIEESLETGIMLTGTEIKSIRAGKVNLSHSFARAEGGELWLLGSHIAHYEGGSCYNHEPTRRRKLLLHREQIDRLIGKTRERGFTLVPLSLYLKDGIAKVELGLAKGKKLYDKRQTIAQREAEREMERMMKARS
jgi:SsrA-binding protein